MQLVQSIGPYQLGPVLGHGASSVVYRAECEGLSFAIKVQIEGKDSSDGVARFRREAAALARLNHTNLPKVVEVGEKDGRCYLVMEFVEGRLLSDVLKKGVMPLVETRACAEGVAEALVEIHRHGLAHRDIKPGNIIVLPNNSVKLVDFDLAVETTGTNSETAAGTFIYAAPEQSGIIKRRVDGRSDLYALGGVLFECCVGRPPFESLDITELLKLHATEVPAEVRKLNRYVGQVFSRIVAKLLAKDPDDRYQTAESLLFDLRNLDALERQLEGGSDITLDSRGITTQLDVPLAGRHTEMSILRGAWKSAHSGEGKLVQIEGESGSGKTRLVQEILNECDGVVVLKGKCTKADTIPFGILREAVDDYVSRVSRMAPKERDATVEIIRKAAGDYAGVVRGLSPGLKKLLKDAPAIPPLDPVSEEERFYEKTANFLGALAVGVGPCILFLDDVQWLDASTLEVLKRFTPMLSESPLLVVTASRNDEESSKGLMKFVDLMGEYFFRRMRLRPLGNSEVQELVRSLLGGAEIEERFVDRIAKISNGNPFAVGQYVRSVLDSGLLRPVTGTWQVDWTGLTEATLSQDVFELIIRRLSSLSLKTLEVIQAAAMLGNQFDEELLSKVVLESKTNVLRALEDAIRARLIDPMGKGSYAFVHDRVVEALRADLDEQSLCDLHQKIAEAMEEYADQATTVNIYALARHYAQGHRDKHLIRVCETNYAAGQHAMKAYANQDAYEFLEQARAAADEAQIPLSERVGLQEAIGLTLYRLGKQNQAIEHLEGVLEYATDRMDTARIHYQIAEVLLSQGAIDKTWKYTQAGLTALGNRYPEAKPIRILLGLGVLLKTLFFLKTGYGYGRTKDRERHALLYKLFLQAANCFYFGGSPLIYGHMCNDALCQAHLIGHSPELASGYAHYALLTSVIALKGETRKYSKLAVTMARQVGDPNIEANVRVMGEYLGSEWIGDCGYSRSISRDLIEMVAKWCPPFDWCRTVAAVVAADAIAGRTVDAFQCIAKYGDVVRKGKNHMFLTWFHGAEACQLMLVGRVADALESQKLQLACFEHVTHNAFARSGKYCTELTIALEQRELGDGVEKAIDNFLKLTVEEGADEYWGRWGWALIGYIRLEQLRRAKGARERQKARKALAKLIRQTSLASGRAITPLHRVHHFVFRAALAREDKRFNQAYAFLNRADVLAKSAYSPWADYSTNRERARVAAAQGDKYLAEWLANQAVEVATQQGWRGRARRLSEEFGVVSMEETRAKDRLRSIPKTASSTLQDSLARRQMKALLQVSLATASSLAPDRQARAALDELAHLLRAERAFLFMQAPDSGEMVFHAGRNAEQEDLLHLMTFSTTVLKKVTETRKPLVVTGTEEGEILASESAVAYGLRSIVAAPLLMGERLVGVVYLDNSMAKGVFTQDDVQILSAIGTQIAISMEMAAAAAVEAERQGLEKELELSGAVQALFLPQKISQENDALHLSRLYRPASRCSGDWWNYRHFSESKLRVVVGDVMGHGAGPAIITASVATCFRTLERHFTNKSPERLLRDLNHILFDVTKGQHHMTFAMMEFDTREMHAQIWSAGAPPVLVARNGEVDGHYLAGTPLGHTLDFEVQHARFDIVPGQRVYLYTDGLTELELAGGRVLGIKRLQQVISSFSDLSPEDAMESFEKQLDEIRKPGPATDDIIMVTIDVVA